MGEKPQVKLRALEPEDLNFLYEIENDEMIWNVGLTNVPYSKNLLLDYIASSSGDIFSDKQVRMIIVNERGEDVGMVDLIDFSPAHQRAELGLVIKVCSEDKVMRRLLSPKSRNMPKTSCIFIKFMRLYLKIM